MGWLDALNCWTCAAVAFAQESAPLPDALPTPRYSSIMRSGTKVAPLPGSKDSQLPEGSIEPGAGAGGRNGSAAAEAEASLSTPANGTLLGAAQGAGSAPPPRSSAPRKVALEGQVSSDEGATPRRSSTVLSANNAREMSEARRKAMGRALLRDDGDLDEFVPFPLSQACFGGHGPIRRACFWLVHQARPPPLNPKL